MKKALIEKARNRLCQVEPVNPAAPNGEPFPVAPSLEWRDCADDVKPETHYFDGSAFIARGRVDGGAAAACRARRPGRRDRDSADRKVRPIVFPRPAGGGAAFSFIAEGR